MKSAISARRANRARRARRKRIKIAIAIMGAFLAVGIILGCGAVFTAEKEDNSGILHHNPDEKNGWIHENGTDKYYKDGTVCTGWHYMGEAESESTPHWLFFDSEGTKYTGWHHMNDKDGEETLRWYYFGTDGRLRTGWQHMGKGTAEPDGGSEEHWCYFGDDGWLRTGWLHMGKGTAEPDGGSEEHWCYFGADGWMRTGWLHMGRGTAEADGDSEEHWCYFGNDGWLRTGLQTMGTGANSDGNSEQRLSYFGENGWLVECKTFTYNDEQYIADERGWAVSVSTEHEKVLARAMELVEEITTDDMTKEEKLWACYVYIRDNYPEYNPRIPHYAGEGWHITYANDVFVGQDGRKGGNCISVGAALAYMAKAIGFENVYAVNGTGHGWAEINDLVYDAEWERHNDGSFYALSYHHNEDKPNYNWIFGSDNPYARIKL